MTRTSYSPATGISFQGLFRSGTKGIIDEGSGYLKARQKNRDVTGRDCTGKTDGGNWLGRFGSNREGERMTLAIAHISVGLPLGFSNTPQSEFGQSLVFFLESVVRKSGEISNPDSGLFNGEGACCGKPRMQPGIVRGRAGALTIVEIGNAVSPHDTHRHEIAEFMKRFKMRNGGIQKTGRAQTLCGKDMNPVTGRIFSVAGLKKHSHRRERFE